MTKRAYDPVFDSSPCCGYRPSLAITERKQVVFCLGCGRNLAPYILFPNEPGLELTTGLVGEVAADESVQGVLW